MPTCKVEGCDRWIRRPAFLCIRHWLDTPEKFRKSLKLFFTERANSKRKSRDYKDANASYNAVKAKVLAQHNGHPCLNCGEMHDKNKAICKPCRDKIGRRLHGAARLRAVDAAWAPMRTVATRHERREKCRAAVKAALEG